MTTPQRLAYPDDSKEKKSHGHDTRLSTAAVTLLAIGLTGCARAPSFDIWGSFFPAWLFCLVVGLLLTFLARWVLLRFGVVLAIPILTYPCLTALLACVLWLAFFQ